MRIPRWYRHNKLDFDTRRNSKLWAHDEYGLCSVGDLVCWPPRARQRGQRAAQLLGGPGARGAAIPTPTCALPARRQVRIEPCRALSKRKAHVVVEILKKEDGSPPPVPFPKW